MKLTQPAFGRFVKQQRLLMGLTLPQLAERAKVSKGNLSKIEHGADVQLTTINKLLNALNQTAVIV